MAKPNNSQLAGIRGRRASIASGAILSANRAAMNAGANPAGPTTNQTKLTNVAQRSTSRKG